MTEIPTPTTVRHQLTLAIAVSLTHLLAYSAITQLALLPAGLGDGYCDDGSDTDDGSGNCALAKTACFQNFWLSLMLLC